MISGTTYWSQRLGPRLWTAFDRGVVRDELQQIAATGVQAIRLPLHWESFQPRPERISTDALRVLEEVLTQASDAGLQVVPVLLPLAVGGAIHLPAWATAASYAADLAMSTKFGPLLLVPNEAQPPLVWEQTQHTSTVRDLWTNQAMQNAQRKLIAEVVGYFADHPVLLGWELGSGIELAVVPPAPDAAAEWLGETADAVRKHGARCTLFYHASLRTLVRREGPRPSAIKEAGCVPVLGLVPPEPAWSMQSFTPDTLLFVVALVQALGGGVPWLMWGVPAVTNGSGRSIEDRAYGRVVTQPLADHDEYAQLVETALPRLHAAGVPGLWLQHAFCYPTPFTPETAHSQRERMMGLFDTSGAELPVAAALQRAMQQSAVAVTLPDLDVEGYWNDPAGSFQRLWGER